MAGREVGERGLGSVGCPSGKGGNHFRQVHIRKRLPPVRCPPRWLVAETGARRVGVRSESVRVQLQARR